MKAKDHALSDGGSVYHGSLVDLSDRGRLAVLEFTATSVAVLEREQKCKVGIRRYGRKDNQVVFRLVIDSFFCQLNLLDLNQMLRIIIVRIIRLN